MREVLGWMRQRPLRLLGVFLVFLTTGLIIFLMLLDVTGVASNPYLGIVTYLVLPIFLVIGLLLVPLDTWVQRRRAAEGRRVYPVVDLTDTRQRKIAGFFAAASAIILIVASVLAYRSLEFMDTRTFCGMVCHKVMAPELTADLRSPHVSVQCVPCHIGPGASWFVRSKLTGVPQVWHYTLGDYPRPLANPVAALRPSRETCEACHWTGQFFGDRLRTQITYLTDQKNTRQVRSMLMHVGSGGVLGSGIHGHMVKQIQYLPATTKRDTIAWVRVKRPDGTTQEYVNPDYSSRLATVRKQHPQRLMDCIDCHNRAAHDFEPFETLLDDGLTRGTVDPSLPFIKQQAMQAAGEPEKVPTQAEYSRALDNIGRIRDYYQAQLPDIARTRAADIDRSVRAVQEIYRGTYFPHMRVGPGTYPNWRTMDGCFRCHGTLQASGTGEMLSNDCALCHTEQVEGASVRLQSSGPGAGAGSAGATGQ